MTVQQRARSTFAFAIPHAKWSGASPGLGLGPSPRIEDAGHLAPDPPRELALHSGNDRVPRLRQQSEPVLFLVDPFGHPSMTSPSIVLTVQPTPSRYATAPSRC